MYFQRSRLMSVAGRLAAVAALAVPPTAAVLHAAESSTVIAGSVLDPEGKAVVDAIVLVRNEDTQAMRATTTDGTGHFMSPDLAAGTYTLELAIPGFDIVRRNGVMVASGQTLDVPIRLSVANVSEAVTVSAALPQAAVAAP